MALDFTRAAALFMATEEELALALRIPLGDLRAFRNDPGRVPSSVTRMMGQVLIDRGKGMQRVGEILLSQDDDC